jgi:hypothetical protein
MFVSIFKSMIVINSLPKSKINQNQKSSTDHLPIMAEIRIKVQQEKKAETIKKRCMKNFTQQKWIECLAGKEWEDLGRTEDVNEMAEDFNNKVKAALDVCAPWKNIKIHQNYKSGISEKQNN